MYGGGTSLTNGADCSGFVQSVYKNFGISIPRTSAEQSKFGKKVSFEDLQPGDLVFYAGHVVMSIGDGRIVHASSAKEGIKVGNDVTYRYIRYTAPMGNVNNPVFAGTYIRDNHERRQEKQNFIKNFDFIGRTGFREPQL